MKMRSLHASERGLLSSCELEKRPLPKMRYFYYAPAKLGLIPRQEYYTLEYAKKEEH